MELFRAYAPPRPVRLLGVRVAGFAEEPELPAPRRAGGQLALFSVEGGGEPAA